MQKLSALPTTQSGAVLIVSLVILVVISLLGIANMQSSNTELKMATSQRDRDVAFAAAEAALTEAEQWLEKNNPTREQLYNTCGDSGNCYNATCSEGLCFEGIFVSDPNEKWLCQVAANSGSSERIAFWKDEQLDVWSDTGKHRTIAIPGIDEDVKFIVEFLCFVPPDDSVTFNSSNPGTGEPLYRVTAMADGNGDRAKVMLQSTYMVVE